MILQLDLGTVESIGDESFQELFRMWEEREGNVVIGITREFEQLSFDTLSGDQLGSGKAEDRKAS